MPKSIIREFDNSTTGSILSSNFSVLGPGYMNPEKDTEKLKNLAKADIIKFINKQKDLKKIFKPSEDKVYLSTRAAQNAFIKLLDDDYVKSSLSKKNYDALKKKRR